MCIMIKIGQSILSENNSDILWQYLKSKSIISLNRLVIWIHKRYVLIII